MSLPFKAPKTISVEEFLERNREYATVKHRQLPPFVQLVGNDVKANAPHVVVVSCLDSRADPYTVLGVQRLECIVFRNVSGRIGPVLRDIAALDTFFCVNQIFILHHSNCGATHFTLDVQMDDIRAKCPGVSEDELETVARLSPVRPDDDTALRADLKTLSECSFLRKDLLANIFGLYLDVKTGLVREVRV